MATIQEAREVEFDLAKRKEIKGINPMCLKCASVDCSGTTNPVWSDCVYRVKIKREDKKNV